MIVALLLFASGLAAGAAAFDALLELTGARWADPFRAILEIAAPALAVAALLFLIAIGWRDAAALAAFAALSAIFVRRRQAATAVIALIAFVAAASFIAIHVLMRPDPEWTSTLFPGYFAATELYSGVSACVLIASFNGRLDETRASDAGKLLLGLSLVWVYLFWSQYLVSWYGNLPDDFRFIVERTRGARHAVAVAVIACCFAAPFLILTARRSRMTVAAASATALAGILLERLLLV
jgi:hypothetical protein